MRHTVIFCAVAFGMGCSASAAELGLASFYGDSAGGLTAAHRSLPFGSQVRIVNLDNGRAVTVKIVDRGPFIEGRIIDVSPAAATSLGFRDAGLAHVKIDLVSLEASHSGSLAVQQAAYAPASTSSYAICRYGADRLDHLQNDSVGEGAAPPQSAVGCQDLRSRLFLFAQKSDDLAPLAARGGAFLTETEAAARIPVNAIAEIPERDASVTEMAAAASIPVGPLAAIPEKREQTSASNPFGFFFTRLRHFFD
jgi:rare lipoprotein A